MQKSNNEHMQSKLAPEKESKVAGAITNIHCIAQFMQYKLPEWR